MQPTEVSPSDRTRGETGKRADRRQAVSSLTSRTLRHATFGCIGRMVAARQAYHLRRRSSVARPPHSSNPALAGSGTQIVSTTISEMLVLSANS